MEDNNDVNTLSNMFSRVNVKTDLAAKNEYVMKAVNGTGISWTDIARRQPFHTFKYGDDFTNWVTEEVTRRSNPRSSKNWVTEEVTTRSNPRSSKNWVTEEVTTRSNPRSSFSSSSIRGIHKGGKKSRRNTRRRKYSKKQKPSRKQTRRHRHRRSRHRR